ncbi:MAG: type II toxin-antitoxin system VapC family toxin [Deltaproteobacteria bacterium]|nr:type II toxin-antitoxin system VapC family toxin [Deltaproteobacteria bacterium]
MYYIDTSVLVAYYCPEPCADKADDFLSETDTPYISILTEIEIFSALSRKLRNKEMDQTAAKRIAARFLLHLEGHYYKYLPLGANHYALAREWISQFRLPLKTLDALHLALASCENLTIVTLDRQLHQNAKKLEIKSLLLDEQR